MPLGTLDRRAPPLFRQGLSPVARLALLGALAVFLMVADARFQIIAPVRSGLATALYPLQWLVLQPVSAARNAAGYLDALHTAQALEAAATKRLAEQSLKGGEAAALQQENARLRALLGLRDRLQVQAQPTEVLYEAADSYTRKVVVDRGSTHGVVGGSPVIDEAGVLGQVTRVHPFVSEVTLVVDRDQAIPVLNARTGVRSVAYGDPTAPVAGGAGAGAMELRYTQANADVKEGDLLTTSGVDGVYPAGLAVARIVRIERRADTAFARIVCEPAARVDTPRHAMVLAPLSAQLPPRPQPEPAAAAPRRGARR